MRVFFYHVSRFGLDSTLRMQREVEKELERGRSAVTSGRKTRNRYAD